MYPLSLRYVLKCETAVLNVISEDLVRRSLLLHLFNEALFDPWWVAVREMLVLKCFSRFYVQYRLVCESFAFVNACVKEPGNICGRYFSRKLDGGYLLVQ